MGMPFMICAGSVSAFQYCRTQSGCTRKFTAIEANAVAVSPAMTRQRFVTASNRGMKIRT
jgi:hypothetical protein